MVDDPDGPAAVQASALVNRYVVDRVAADIILGFFFPGATMVLTGGHGQVAAGVAGAEVIDPPPPSGVPPSPDQGHGIAL